MKELEINELVEGECYVKIDDDGDRVVFRCSNSGEARCPNSLYLPEGDKTESGRDYDGTESVYDDDILREATAEEARHLDACVKAKKYVDSPDVAEAAENSIFDAVAAFKDRRNI